MKLLKTSLLALLLVLLLVSTIGAEEVELPQLEGPFLITSVGQSPEAMMIRALSNRSQIPHLFHQVIMADELEEVSTIIMVVGGSLKGLGAAGLDQNKEMARTEELLEVIAEKEIYLIAMHLGGTARRGTMSDDFIEAVFPKAQLLMVYEPGDPDAMMASIAEEYEIPLLYLEMVVEAEELLKLIFLTEE